MPEEISLTDKLMLLYLCKKERDHMLQRLEQNNEEKEKIDLLCEREIHLSCIIIKLINTFPEQARNHLCQKYNS